MAGLKGTPTLFRLSLSLFPSLSIKGERPIEGRREGGTLCVRVKGGEIGFMFLLHKAEESCVCMHVCERKTREGEKGSKNRK